MVAIRRAALVAGLILGAATASAATPSSARTARPAPRDWTSIGFSNGNTAHDPTERTLTSKSVHTLRPVAHRSMPFMGGPLIVAHHRLFGLCGRHDVGICAWSTSTLHRLWQTRVAGVSEEMDLAAGAHLLVVHAEGSTRYLALRQSSGTRAWRVHEPDPTLTVGLPPPVVTAKTLSYVDGRGRVVRRSLRTGALRSRVAPNQMRPSAANNALLWELAGAVVTHHTVYTVVPDDELVAAAPLTCGHRQVCPPTWTAHAGSDAHLIYADHRVFASYRLRYTELTAIGAYDAATGRREFTLRSPQVGGIDEGEVEYLEAARDLVFFSDQSGYVRAWRASGCGHRVCQPVWRSQPIRGQIEVPQFVETNGRLFTEGGYVYATAKVRRSPYGPPAAPKHIKVDYDPRFCSDSLTWKRPAHRGGLPLTGSTVTLTGGRINYGYPTTGYFNGLPAGTYHAKIAERNAWGRGPATSTTFTVPKCAN